MVRFIWFWTEPENFGLNGSVVRFSWFYEVIRFKWFGSVLISQNRINRTDRLYNNSSIILDLKIKNKYWSRTLDILEHQYICIKLNHVCNGILIFISMKLWIYWLMYWVLIFLKLNSSIRFNRTNRSLVQFNRFGGNQFDFSLVWQI